ncbi:unnamed protein product [Gordionus sp. m RMFG-2023]|uniref:proteasome activator complex subunit 3-like isoform X2 n=1 Tax=Gordionus sp. m RMFG-2023 TaxID=3053472 RepID=UPI0030DEC2FE
MALMHNKVEDFKERIKEKAEKLVTENFPKKVLEMDKLLNSPEFTERDFKKIHYIMNIPVPTHQNGKIVNGIPIINKKRKTIENENLTDQIISYDEDKKVMLFPNGMFPSNQNIIKLFEILKPYMCEMVEDTNLVKMWILFMIPRIEDGNNFGVSIQEETLAEVRLVETESASYLEQISRYYLTRAKLVSKIAKYPNIEDYQRSVLELDEKQYLTIKLICAELRNNYSSLHDLILKNIEKLKKPKTNNMESLY